MLSPKVQDALNEQVNAEFWSAYLYLSMACNFEADGKPGIANWFRIQFQEEQAHAQIFMNYIHARGGKVVLKPIAEVPVNWVKPLDAFIDTLAHEQKVTALINNIYSIAEAEKDYPTCDRLNWFVNEQVEEEESAQELIDKFRMIGDNGMGLYMLDQELATRVYNVPSPLAAK